MPALSKEFLDIQEMHTRHGKNIQFCPVVVLFVVLCFFIIITIIIVLVFFPVYVCVLVYV